jgi:hypothetical protein
MNPAAAYVVQNLALQLSSEVPELPLTTGGFVLAAEREHRYLNLTPGLAVIVALVSQGVNLVLNCCFAQQPLE